MELQLKNVKILKEGFNPIVIYFFGSAAKNKLRPGSDITFITDNEVNSQDF